MSVDASWRAALDRDGWRLERGAQVRSAQDLADVRRRLGGVVAPVGERFTPREDRGDGVTGEALWPPERMLCASHDGSVTSHPPDVLLYACLVAPREGGELILCDAARVLEEVPADLGDRVRDDGWVLTRTFHRYVGMAWTDAFGVADEAALAQFCARENVRFEWTAEGRLHTRRHLPGVVRHPRTGRELWFNGLGFFNRLTLVDRERAVLIAAFGEGGLPMDTLVGDGAQLTPAEYVAIEAAYTAARTVVALEPGDLLIVDNRRTATGRMPFRGERDVLMTAVDFSAARVDSSNVTSVNMDSSSGRW